MPDIREIMPGDGCIRTRHEFDFGDRTSNAGAYLLMSAIEAAGLHDSVDPVIEQSAATFLHSFAPSEVNGAVGFCGRKIGKGACGRWELDEETLQIVPRSTQS
jgi:hypothetical protein